MATTAEHTLSKDPNRKSYNEYMNNNCVNSTTYILTMCTCGTKVHFVPNFGDNTHLNIFGLLVK